MSGPTQFLDYAIVPHPREPRLLLMPSQAGWGLPHVEHAERHFWQSVALVNRAIGALLGLEVTTLRCVWTDYGRNLYALESHDSEWTPPAGAGWFGAEQLADLPLAEPAHRAHLDAWFAEVSEGPPAGRVPWYSRGWYGVASEWIHARLAELGTPAVGPIEQLRSWERSAILRAHTAAGDVYFKAVPPMFAHEPALAQALAEHDPAHFAAVLAVDAERHWMLMPDAGSQTLDQLPDIERWEAALRRFAQLQIALSSEAPSLVDLGCPSRPLELLATQIDPLLGDTAALTPESAPLAEQEIAELRAQAPRFKTMCARLASYGIPLSLEHGDFWPGQVIVRGADDVFIDWSDSSIAHPFFSLNFFADTAEAEQFLPGLPNLRTRLRDAYLEPWKAHAPAERLVEAYELAQPLSALHNAVTYHSIILPAMHARWEMHNMIPFYLRKLLAATGDGSLHA